MDQYNDPRHNRLQQPQPPPPNREDALMAHLHRLEQKFDTMVPGAVRAVPSTVDTLDQFEQDLAPATKLVRAAKWVGGIVIPLVMLTAGWVRWGDALATKGDLKQHVDDDFAPMQTQVEVVDANVQLLLSETKRDREIAKLERRVTDYQADFNAKMAKYHGKRSRYPERYFKEPEPPPELASAKIALREALAAPVLLPVQAVARKP